MRNRHVLLAITLGLFVTVAILLLLPRAAAVAHANGAVLYVRSGGLGDCLSTTTPCGSVQEAIDLALAPDDQVWVAAGTYTENLTIAHSVQVRGGWNVSFTQQNPDTTPTVLDGNAEHNVRVENTPPSDQITLESLTLRNGTDGIHVWSGRVTVEGCVIQDANKQGIEIDGGTVLISATQILNAQQGIEVDDGQVQAIDVRIAFTDEEGLFVEAGGDVTFTHGTIEYCSQQCVQINRGSLWLFDNTIHNVSADGVRAEGGTTLIVSNTIFAIAADGVDVSGTHTISANLVYDTGKWGIYAHDGTLAVLNNTVHDTDDSGIRVADGTVATLQGNRVTDAGNHGIDARGAAVTVTDNRVDGVGDRGINAEDGALTITLNHVYNAGADGIRTAGASTQVEIRGNMVYTVGNDGIDARGDVIDVSHNTVRNSADNGIKSEGDESTHIEANSVFGNGVGLAIRGAQAFTVANNMIGDHVTASVELTGLGTGSLYHNTLVGHNAHVQGIGLTIPDPLTLSLANNVIVSHSVGISATAQATLLARNTLLWGNDDDPISGTGAILSPPMLMAPAQHDYHLRPGSPAIDAGTTVDVFTDADGEPRPIGPRPDVGADEFPAGLSVTKHADPFLVEPGKQLTYTLRVTNTGILTLAATITDTLPAHVAPSGTRTWTATIPTPAGVWTETVVVTVNLDHSGPLVNVVQVTTEEGATGVYTHTLAPDLEVTKRAHSDLVVPGEPLTYTLYVTNTGNFHLNTTITDVLPSHVTPGGARTWTATIPTPAGVWTETVVVTPEMGYAGPLTNVVQVTTEEGAAGVYTHTLAPDLEVTKRAAPDPVQAGERLTYTIQVTNTGNFALHAHITDTLPTSVTLGETSGGTLLLPGGNVAVIWTTAIATPGDVWRETVVVTAPSGYAGPLTNVVRVSTDEGVTGVHALTSHVIEARAIYLPLVLRYASSQ
jgi:uncharacterized repeat protein (TIGR01451 family)